MERAFFIGKIHSIKIQFCIKKLFGMLKFYLDEEKVLVAVG